MSNDFERIPYTTVRHNMVLINADRSSKPYQPKTGAKCSCRRGIERDNCPQCEGTGWRIDFRVIRERGAQ